MKKLILLSFILISWFAKGQDYQQLCLDCAEQEGFYCGDDPANWTQYSPNGCVPNGLNNLFYLNDGWEDCVDGSDEQDAVPTASEECIPEEVPCDTVYVDIIEYETIFDTIYETEYIIDTFYVDIINWFPEYVDCETMLPCNSGIGEILDKSIKDGLLYNLFGQPIRKPEGIYIEGGKVKYLIK
tara:strand:+ start:804 stop:1355 length:552 start_codon:yes stop_codon:yes gene_type:complete